MRNLFKRIAEWHLENKQYDGFFEFESFSFLTLFLLIGNICIRNTSVVDWLIWVIWLQGTLFQSYRWTKERSIKHIMDFESKRFMELFNQQADQVIEQHERLIAANRRRKRAERALKKCRLELRNESANRLGFELQADEYEKILLYVHTLVDEESFAHHDPLAVAEAERRIKKYLREHFSDIAAHQAYVTLAEDVFECLFLGDAPSNETKENQEQ